MTIRRINSTGRKSIVREDAAIFLRPGADGVLTFDASLDLTDYDLPDDAQVFVEAYRQTLFMRFQHGTVASPKPQAGATRKLTEFATRDGLLFRVKVTSTGDGLLLAEGDRIAPKDDDEQPDRRIALLPPVPANLGQEVWRIELNDNTGPQLLVNENIGDWKAVASSVQFRSLAFPAAMRQVLTHAVLVHAARDTDDPSDWGCQWLQFAASLPGVASIPQCESDEDFDPTEWIGWIDDAVEAFARQHQLFDHFKAEFTAEVSG